MVSVMWSCDCLAHLCQEKLSSSAFFDCEKCIPNKTHPTTTSHSAPSTTPSPSSKTYLYWTFNVNANKYNEGGIGPYFFKKRFLLILHLQAPKCMAMLSLRCAIQAQNIDQAMDRPTLDRRPWRCWLDCCCWTLTMMMSSIRSIIWRYRDILSQNKTILKFIYFCLWDSQWNKNN